MTTGLDLTAGRFEVLEPKNALCLASLLLFHLPNFQVKAWLQIGQQLPTMGFTSPA